MPPVLLKEYIVQIKQSLGRYLSIMAIVALGVSFFAGIKASAPDMKAAADAHFDNANTQDIQIYSTIGLDEKDVEAISKLDGVEEVQPGFSMDFLTRRQSREMVVKVIGYEENQSMNQPILVEGRMPEEPDECLLEASGATSNLFGTYSLGDRIRLYSGTDTPVSDVLDTSTYIIVGKAYNPNYLSYQKGSSSIGSGSVDTFIYVPMDSVKADYYTEIDVTVQDAKNLNTYSDEYFDVVEPVVDAIETISSTQIERRIADSQSEVDKARNEMNAKLADASSSLQEGKDQLDAAAAKITSGLAQIASGESELASSKEQLDAGWQAWNEGNAQYEEAYPQVVSGIEQIEDAMASLDTLKSQKEQLETALQLLPVLTNGLNRIDELDAKYQDLKARVAELETENPESPDLPTLTDALNAMENLLDEAIANFTGQPGLTVSQAVAYLTNYRDEILSQIGGSQEQGEANLQALNDGIAQIEALEPQLQELLETKEQLDAAKVTLDETYQTLVAAQTQYNQGKDQLAASKEQLASGQKEYEEGRAEYEEGLTEYEKQKADGESQIESAQESVNSLKGEWYVLDRNSHYSYKDYEACAQRMDGIASVFPVFFYLVAALVCMTTMTRMVDEQRSEMGTLKALGYSKLQIAMKYIVYAGSASLIGSLIGAFLGMLIFPTIIFNAWNTMYNLESIRYVFPASLVAGACLSVTAIILLTTLASIYKELLEVPAQLMRPKAAKAGKKILLERIPWIWKKVSFMHKVTIRNLFRYKKRFLMTVIGISGCSALLVAGFGLNDSISDIVPSQYSNIYHYDATVSADSEKNPDLKKQLENLQGIKEVYELQDMSVTVNYDDKDVSATVNIVDSPADFEEFMTFYDMDSSKTLTLDNSGVLLSIKTAEKMNLSKGDMLTFETLDGQEVNVPVAGIFEQYIGHQIYMTKDLFDSLGINEEPSSLYLLENDSTDTEFESELGSEIMNLEGVSSLTFYSSLQENFLNMISSIKLVVVVLVLSAAMLAFVVLYNLSNVNISERMREIATIKVLGFREKEVNAYVNRETILLALIGSLAGLVLGIYLHHMIMSLAELDTVRFGRTILWQSYAYSVALTMLFTFIINWVMKFKLRKIMMVESLKAVE